MRWTIFWRWLTLCVNPRRPEPKLALRQRLHRRRWNGLIAVKLRVAPLVETALLATDPITRVRNFPPG